LTEACNNILINAEAYNFNPFRRKKMSKRLFVVLSLVVMASMLFAACATPATQAPASTQAPAATEAPAATQAPAAGCTDKIGCVEIGPTDPIHIAYALSISGDNAALGTDSRNGAEIAVDDIGGTLLNHKIQFDGEDEGCSAEGGQAAGTKLASDTTIVAILGTSCSSAVRVAEPLWSQAGFVTISPSNTAPDLTEAGNPNNYPGYLRTAHNDKVQGAVAAKFALEKLGAKSAATIHDGSIYAEGLANAFAENFKAGGGTITNQEAVDPKATDMGPVLTRIAANKPDLIYYPIFLPAGGFITRQAKETAGLENTKLMGADGLFSPDVVKAAGDAVEGFMVSSPDFSQFGPDYESKFVPEYLAKFGGTAPISIFHAHAYDAMNMIFACVKTTAVQASDGSLSIGRQALRDCMYATKDFKGLTGNLTCTPTGDCADPKIAVYEYHTGQYPPTKIWP
jgi:branched-chain amino acid transport system substrate-binding protein